MRRRRRAEDDEIRLRCLQALAIVGEDALSGDGEVARGGDHPLRLFVADAGDLHVGMRVRHTQQIAHVHVVEVDADDFEFRHISLLIRTIFDAKTERRRDAQSIKNEQCRLFSVLPLRFCWVYFRCGVRVVGHRLRRDMAPVTPEAMTYKTISAPNVK